MSYPANEESSIKSGYGPVISSSIEKKTTQPMLSHYPPTNTSSNIIELANILSINITPVSIEVHDQVYGWLWHKSPPVIVSTKDKDKCVESIFRRYGVSVSYLI
jgi:hypothetical protein